MTMSPAELLTLLAFSALALAALAWTADRRRMRRLNLDKVGWMPWTGMFFWTLLVAVILLSLAAKAWLTG